MEVEIESSEIENMDCMDETYELDNDEQDHTLYEYPDSDVELEEEIEEVPIPKIPINDGEDDKYPHDLKLNLSWILGIAESCGVCSEDLKIDAAEYIGIMAIRKLRTIMMGAIQFQNAENSRSLGTSHISKAERLLSASTQVSAGYRNRFYTRNFFPIGQMSIYSPDYCIDLERSVMDDDLIYGGMRNMNDKEKASTNDQTCTPCGTYPFLVLNKVNPVLHNETEHCFESDDDDQDNQEVKDSQDSQDSDCDHLNETIEDNEEAKEKEDDKEQQASSTEETGFSDLNFVQAYIEAEIDGKSELEIEDDDRSEELGNVATNEEETECLALPEKAVPFLQLFLEFFYQLDDNMFKSEPFIDKYFYTLTPTIVHMMFSSVIDFFLDVLHQLKKRDEDAEEPEKLLSTKDKEYYQVLVIIKYIELLTSCNSSYSDVFLSNSEKEISLSSVLIELMILPAPEPLHRRFCSCVTKILKPYTSPLCRNSVDQLLQWFQEYSESLLNETLSLEELNDSLKSALNICLLIFDGIMHIPNDTLDISSIIHLLGNVLKTHPYWTSWLHSESQIDASLHTTILVLLRRIKYFENSYADAAEEFGDSKLVFLAPHRIFQSVFISPVRQSQKKYKKESLNRYWKKRYEAIVNKS